jgi:hypothetical protein
MAGQLFVTEYTQLGLYGEQQVPQEPSQADYVVNVLTASITPAQAFLPQTRFVRLHAAANALSVAFGPFGTAAATVNNQRLAANQTEYKAIPQGAGWTVAAIPATTP